jgi:intein/homing endonuclease
MKIAIVSDFLTKLNVWHKIEGNFIRTKRTCLKIPRINNKVAYFTGVITGDGSITKCKRKVGGYCYRIQIVGYKEYMGYLTTLTRDLFNYQPRILKDKRKKHCYLINIYSAAIFVYFVKLGLPVGKKRTLSVPKIIANNPTLFKHYMLGLIDTDGHVRNRRVQLKQRLRPFLEELVGLLEKHFNIKANPPKVNYTEGKPYFYIRFPLSQLSMPS